MKFAIELTEAQLAKLRERASRLGLEPEELAKAALADLLETPNDEFRTTAERVLQDNSELYRRLR
ncbi:MAG: DNA-binding protein [Planctomycetes bacterium]|nr:DNA-binding protein [Planctomycetota bacterium]